MKVRRSGLTMPVITPRFVDNAWRRGCDFVVLDLEDSVPRNLKDHARTLIKDAIPNVSKGGAEAFTRINHELMEADTAAVVWPGLKRIKYPKTETADEVRALDALITRYEKERGMELGSIEIDTGIETALAITNVYDIASASPRIKELSATNGGYDMSRDLGVEMFVPYDQFVYLKGEAELAARALGLGVRTAPFVANTTGSVSDGDRALRQAEAARAGFAHDGQPMHPLGEVAFTVDATKAARGKAVFASAGCASCHATGPERIASTVKAPAFNELKSLEAGCLASAPAKTAPKFALSETQRAALRDTLAAKDALNTALTPPQRVERTLAQMNCIACHQRDGQGGPAAARAAFFSPAIEADLGDEGRIPPHLTGVGHKLRADWLERVLWKGAAVRPYMATRMPQFGEANVKHLVADFAAVDARPGTLPTPAENPALAKQGHKLAGTTGLSCIACHTFAGRASLGVPALDLTTVPERLEWDWFRRYLLNPQALRPGTRMPPFWPDGKAANQTILGGDVERQVAALWAFLARGAQAELPPGLITGKMELVATNEALIYRNFIEGAGSRAIGVALPEKVNYAFDANELRLALIWQGPFIDAARHRTGRGVGYEPPLGYGVVKQPPGPELAPLDSPGASWPASSGRSSTGQFQGYTLDGLQRPTFRYTQHGVAVEDAIVAVNSPAESGLQRTLTLRAAQPIAGLHFRAAVGTKIEVKGGNTFLVDGKVRVRLTGSEGQVRESGGRQELLAPLVFQNGTAKLVEELVW